MKIVLKVAVTIFATLVLGIVTLKVAVYRYALSEQHKAERLLTVVRNLRPGIITAAELDNALLPLKISMTGSCVDGDNKQLEAEFYNAPDWKIFNNDHTSAGLQKFESSWILPRWTMFGAAFRCDSGVLNNIHLFEMQEAPGWPHPFSGDADVLPIGSIANGNSAEKRSQDRNYWLYEYGSSLYQDGTHILDSPTLHREVHVTPDASTQEREQALAFHLDCFTRWSGCQTVDRIFTPAPKRP